MLTVENLI
jgi:period circadian protein 2